jgi:tetratricopeptide (TPR) repeat protein
MAMPYQLRAHSEFQKGDLAAAEADYQKLTELRPQEAFYWSELAGMKLRRQDFEGAISALNKVIEVNPHIGGYVLARADIKRERGDYQGALNDYRTGLDRSLEANEQVSTRFSIWECEVRLGGKSTANKHLSHYLGTLTGPYDDWTVKIGRFLLNESDTQSFLADATKAGQIDQAQHFVDLRKQVLGD